MKSRGINFIGAMTRALALACCLVVGALPLGQVPHFVGRCGKSLCHCAPEKAPVKDIPNNSLPEKSSEPQKFLTLASGSLAGAEDILALQEAFSAFVTPVLPGIVADARRPERKNDLQHSMSRPAGYTGELSTPPPRCTA